MNTLKRRYKPTNTGAGVINYHPENHTFILENNCLYNNIGGNYVNAESASDVYSDPASSDQWVGVGAPK
jgi:hypothetical protein